MGAERVRLDVHILLFSAEGRNVGNDELYQQDEERILLGTDREPLVPRDARTNISIAPLSKTPEIESEQKLVVAGSPRSLGSPASDSADPPKKKLSSIPALDLTNVVIKKPKTLSRKRKTRRMRRRKRRSFGKKKKKNNNNNGVVVFPQRDVPLAKK